MEKLSRKLIKEKPRKIKIVQFGEGNFLRAFVDFIIQKMNNAGVYVGNVAVVQPMPFGRVSDLASQDGLYTLYLEGIENGSAVSRREVINVLSEFVNPYNDYANFLKLADNPDLEIVISNTTEAGISLDEKDTDFSVCPTSFPGKLLALLLRRFETFKGDSEKGLMIIPCELIDDNGEELKKALNGLCEKMKLPNGFVEWLNSANEFTSTLVDRIVPGYPSAEIDKIKAECCYEDNSVVKGEIFHFWVLKKNAKIEEKFPADRCGLNVVYASDIKPYKERKVKILNGSHTAIVPIGYLMGYDTVGDTVRDKQIATFLNGLVASEINPTIALGEKELAEFASSVLERFLNPYIRHELMSIALNSITKFKTRLLPTLKDYVAKTHELPKRLLFAFAALILFYKGERGNTTIALKDDEKYLNFFKKTWQESGNDISSLAIKVCGYKEAFGEDINEIHPEIAATVAEYLSLMLKEGMGGALKEFLSRK